MRSAPSRGGPGWRGRARGCRRRQQPFLHHRRLRASTRLERPASRRQFAQAAAVSSSAVWCKWSGRRSERTQAPASSHGIEISRSSSRALPRRVLGVHRYWTAQEWWKARAIMYSKGCDTPSRTRWLVQQLVRGFPARASSSSSVTSFALDFGDPTTPSCGRVKNTQQRSTKRYAAP